MVQQLAEKDRKNIWISAGDGDIDKVQSWLEGGTDVNVQDDTGYAAIHAAVSYNQLEMVKYLIENGANLELEDSDGDTPLFFAESQDMVKFLIEDCKVNIEHENKDKHTAFKKYLEDERIDLYIYACSLTKKEADLDTELPETHASINAIAETEDEELASLEPLLDAHERERMRDLISSGTYDEENVRNLIRTAVQRSNLGDEDNADEHEARRQRT